MELVVSDEVVLAVAVACSVGPGSEGNGAVGAPGISASRGADFVDDHDTVTIHERVVMRAT